LSYERSDYKVEYLFFPLAIRAKLYMKIGCPEYKTSLADPVLQGWREGGQEGQYTWGTEISVKCLYRLSTLYVCPK
jgi:hypothetical protein